MGLDNGRDNVDRKKTGERLVGGGEPLTGKGIESSLTKSAIKEFLLLFDYNLVFQHLASSSSLYPAVSLWWLQMASVFQHTGGFAKSRKLETLGRLSVNREYRITSKMSKLVS
jgi:hypothetical protein